METIPQPMWAKAVDGHLLVVVGPPDLVVQAAERMRAEHRVPTKQFRAAVFKSWDPAVSKEDRRVRLPTDMTPDMESLLAWGSVGGQDIPQVGLKPGPGA